MYDARFDLNARVRAYSIAASICLHILLLLLWVLGERLDLFAIAADRAFPTAEEPLIFEIVQPREVIETPDDAETVDNQQKADYLSDKNALARNNEPAPDLELADPYARGDLDVPELPTQQLPPGNEMEKAMKGPETEEATDGQPEDDSRTDDLYAYNSLRDLPRESLLRSPSVGEPGIRDAIPGVLFDNPDSRASDTGGLSFNTYDWDFAPYMLTLKKKIQRNIYPPMAFTSMGWISGESTIKFRIYPSGRMEGLEVLGYTGHRSLMETSYQAIEISAPFSLLPPDFPEEYLEVTARFSYLVGKPHN